jgi:nucleotide-binding universal stress UspA family protein
MKKILVPVDFSDESLNALKYAAAIAKKLGATIKLLNILEAPASDSFSPGADGNAVSSSLTDVFVLKLREKNIERIKELANQPEYKGIVTEFKVHIDVIWDRIAKTISEIDAYMVVMGTKGTSNLDDIFIGSNAEKVVRFANVPVLTVRKDASFEDLKDIVLPSNFKERFPKIMAFLKEFSQVMGAKLHLLRINTPGAFLPTEKSKALISKFAEDHGIEQFEANVYSDYTEEEGIRDYANYNKMNMIAMMTHGRHGLSRVFTSSIAEEIVNKASIPVLSLNLNIEKEAKNK